MGRRERDGGGCGVARASCCLLVHRALLQMVGGDKAYHPLLLMGCMNPFKGQHFQRDIILWACAGTANHGIQLPELQEMLAERPGEDVDHSTILPLGSALCATEMEKRLRWYWRNPLPIFAAAHR